MKNIRFLAWTWIIECTGPNHTLGSDAQVRRELAQFSSQDRDFFIELTRGTIREWRFLEVSSKKFCKKLPRLKLRALLFLSAYQILFLDRVPTYAVFSQALELGRDSKFSRAELAFIQGVLKRFEEKKQELLEWRAQELSKAQLGQDASCEVLNTTDELVELLSVEGNRSRALCALAAMKSRLPLVGYVLPTCVPLLAIKSFSSHVAPRAVEVTSEQALGDSAIRIQGEASQWSCELAAKELFDFIEAKSGTKLRILEMTAGKGGKTLGTLAALTALLSNETKKVPAIEWVACDSSQEQLNLFVNETLPILQQLWPQVRVEVKQTDWGAMGSHGINGVFDFIWLDAPCSGLGSAAKHPEVLLQRGCKDVEFLSALQRKCIEPIPTFLSDTARFFYTVCTLTEPETLGVVSHFEKLSGRKAIYTKWLWPGFAPAPRAEGFFAAKC